MQRRVRNRAKRANRGYARGGAFSTHERNARYAQGAGKIFGAALLIVLVIAAIVGFYFGIRYILGRVNDDTPERVSVVYSEEISKKYDREEVYKNGVLFIDYDIVAEILGLTKSKIGDEVSYFTRSGDSMIFTKGSGTVYVNKIPCSAVGAPFFDGEGRLMAAAELINLYVNDTSAVISDSGNTVTLVTVVSSPEELSFNLKKSETLGGMDRPNSFPADTDYNPNGTLPPMETVSPKDTDTVSESTSAAETKPLEPTVGEIIAAYEFKTDISAYKNYLNPENREEYLILANRSYPVGESYIPTELVDLDRKYVIGSKEYKMRETAAKALEAMILEMKADKVWDTYVCSTYRSYEYQVNLYNRYFKQEKANHPGKTDDEIRAIVDTYSSRPGTSDHHTGLCVDFYDVEVTFMKKKAYQWLCDNAYKFGFILRFPDGKTDITGYMFEPWHWRFVGQVPAYEIWKGGLTLEEYLGKVS